MTDQSHPRIPIEMCSHCKTRHTWRSACVAGKYEGLTGPEAMDLYMPGGPLHGCTDSTKLSIDEVQAAAKIMRASIKAAAQARQVDRIKATAAWAARQGA